jgi:hypothetical protein
VRAWFYFDYSGCLIEFGKETRIGRAPSDAMHPRHPPKTITPGDRQPDFARLGCSGGKITQLAD